VSVLPFGVALAVAPGVPLGPELADEGSDDRDGEVDGPLPGALLPLHATAPTAVTRAIRGAWRDQCRDGLETEMADPSRGSRQPGDRKARRARL
jgi:hypothetical protein